MIEEDSPTAERIVTADAPEAERRFEANLRPRMLADFVGQSTLKENLHVFFGRGQTAKRAA